MHLWCCFMMTTILKMTTFVAVTSPQVRAHSGSPERTQVEISFTNHSASSSPPTFCYGILYLFHYISVMIWLIWLLYLALPPVCHFLSHLMLKKLPFLRAYIFVSIRNDEAVLHTCTIREAIHAKKVAKLWTFSVRGRATFSTVWTDIYIYIYNIYITWTGTQTSQQAPSPLSSWKEIYSVKMYSKFIWWDWPRR